MSSLSEINGLPDVTIYHLPYSSKQIAAAVGKSPIIALSEDGNQTWWIWDIGAMAYTDTGVVAYLGDLNEAKAAAMNAQTAVIQAQAAVTQAQNAAISAEGSKDAALEILGEVEIKASGSSGFTGAFSTDFWKFITGTHPVLSSNPYNDYDYIRSKIANQYWGG